MLPNGILFDLDDTIISFDGVSEIAWEKCCSWFVKEFTPAFDEAALLESIQKARRWYWSDTERSRAGRMNLENARRDVVKAALEQLGCMEAEKGRILADYYSKMQEESLCLFPNVKETLEKIKALGIRMALITNGSSEKQRAKLERFSLDGFFEVLLIEEEVGFGKPDSRVYELAIERLNLSTKEVWMVGDNLIWDVEAPQKLGIYSIWNDFRRKGLPKDTDIVPDRTIHSIAELIEGA